MPTRKTLPLWTSFLESQPCSVRKHLRNKKISRKIFFLFRIWAVTKNDLAGLHLWIWRDLWTLPWNQLCLCRRDSLLVLHQALQELLIKHLRQRQSFSIELVTQNDPALFFYLIEFIEVHYILILTITNM